MWKIAVAFIIFAALALYLLSKGGDVDISGEKHGYQNIESVDRIIA
jgi:hypothetical protein